jgi:hypothetical protein
VELVRILKELWARKGLLLLAALVAVYVGLSSAYTVSLFPPSAKDDSLQIGAAQTSVLLDSRQSSLVDLNKDLQPLASRAQIFAQFMRSGPLTEAIARRVHLDPTQITTAGPYGGASGQQPAEPRANTLRGDGLSYRLLFQASAATQGLPIIDIYATAPTASAATRLATAAVDALKSYAFYTAENSGVPGSQRIQVQQISKPVGGVINPGVAKKTVALTTIAVFAGLCVLILVLGGIRRNWRTLVTEDEEEQDQAAAATLPPIVPSDLAEARSTVNGEAQTVPNGNGPAVTTADES